MLASSRRGVNAPAQPQGERVDPQRKRAAAAPRRRLAGVVSLSRARRQHRRIALRHPLAKSQRKNVKNDGASTRRGQTDPTGRARKRPRRKTRRRPPHRQQKHEPPSFLRDLVLYAALGASLGAAFALAVPPLPPPPEAAPSRLLIKAPLATPPRAAANTQLLLAKDAEIERLRTEVKWALTDRASDADFKKELAAHEQRTQQMLKELLREKDALAARDTGRRAARAAERQERRRRRGRAGADARRRPRAPGRRRRRLRRAAVAAAVVVVLPPTQRALFALARTRGAATAAAGRLPGAPARLPTSRR